MLLEMLGGGTMSPTTQITKFIESVASSRSDEKELDPSSYDLKQVHRRRIMRLGMFEKICSNSHKLKLSYKTRD